MQKWLWITHIYPTPGETIVGFRSLAEAEKVAKTLPVPYSKSRSIQLSMLSDEQYRRHEPLLTIGRGRSHFLHDDFNWMSDNVSADDSSSRLVINKNHVYL